MPVSKPLQRIARKGSNKEKIAEEVARNADAIAEVLAGVRAEKPSVRFGCSTVLRLISEKAPAILYRHMDFFVRLLGDQNTFLRMDAARVIGNLTMVDFDGKFDRIFEEYFAPIKGPAMIPAANIIGTAAKIALAKPFLADRIAAEILKVERAHYATAECRNIALGHAIQSFDLFFEQVGDRASVSKLVRKQLKNPRAATRKKAEAFITKYGL
jgi:hypothetical protein